MRGRTMRIGNHLVRQEPPRLTHLRRNFLILQRHALQFQKWYTSEIGKDLGGGAQHLTTLCCFEDNYCKQKVESSIIDLNEREDEISDMLFKCFRKVQGVDPGKRDA